MSAKLHGFLSRYWVYIVTTASVVCLLLLWLANWDGVLIKNFALIHFMIAVPVLTVVYGVQHGQGVWVIAVRAYVPVAVSPALIAATLGLPEWAELIWSEGVRSILKFTALAPLILVEFFAVYLGAKLAYSLVHKPQDEIALEVANRSSLPLPLARFMVWELMFWRRVARFVFRIRPQR